MGLQDRDYMRDTGGFRWPRNLWPDPVTLIVALNIMVFALQHVFGIWGDVVPTRGGGRMILPSGVLSIPNLLDGQVWTVLTHLFVHDSAMHLLGTCLATFFTGKAVQSLIGSRHFLHIYFVSGLVGAAAELIVGWLSRDMHPVVGPSAAVFGTFMALAVMLPQESVTTLVHVIIPVRLRMWTLAMTLLGLSIVFAVLHVTEVLRLGMLHFAHLGGALAGWWFVRLLGYGGPPVTYERMWFERQRREQSQSPPRAYAGVRKTRKTVDNYEPEVEFAPLSKRQIIEQEIDPILDKIAAHGLESLSDEEKSLLSRASDQVRNHSK